MKPIALAAAVVAGLYVLAGWWLDRELDRMGERRDTLGVGDPLPDLPLTAEQEAVFIDNLRHVLFDEPSCTCDICRMTGGGAR